MGWWSIIENLTYDDFTKKYALAISSLKLRMGNVAKDNFVQRLYEDNANGKIDMQELHIATCNFFNGSVKGQVLLNQFMNQYKNI
jgi:hypothetical protein